jgi:hypothetical protein
MQDRRKDHRMPSYLGGLVTFNRRQSAANCLVRNYSRAGAKLMVQDFQCLPNEFELSIPHHQVERQVRVKWRKRDEIGVEAVAGTFGRDGGDAR